MSLLTPNEAIIAEHHAEGARLVHGTGTLALHRLGDKSADFSRGGPALVQPMPQGVDPTMPPAAAFRAVRGVLAYRRDVARIDGDKRLSDEGKREKHVEPAVKAVNEVIAAAKDVGTYAANVEHGAHEFYGVPTLDKGDAVAVLTHREIREKTEGLSTIELSRLARENPQVAEAWMRSPLPLDGQRRALIESAWRGHVAATNPTRAESIAVGERGAAWAKASLLAAARTAAGDLRADGADIVAQLHAHDLDAFNHVFDLPRGEKRLRARLPVVDDAA